MINFDLDITLLVLFKHRTPTHLGVAHVDVTIATVRLFHTAAQMRDPSPMVLHRHRKVLVVFVGGEWGTVKAAVACSHVHPLR